MNIYTCVGSRIRAKLILVFFFFTILFMLAVACTYDPNDEYDANIQSVDPPEASLMINAQDTLLEIWQVTNCIFSFIPEKTLKIHIYNVYIDNELFATMTNANNLFTIDPAKFSSGMHNLVLEVITGTGSGSFADKIGAEELVYRKECKLLIENRTPQSLHILSMKEENGSFKITWENYDRINFQEYIIYRSRTKIQSGNDYFEKVTTIFNANQTSYIDSSYVGGPRMYMINIKASDRIVSGIPETVNYALPRILNTVPEGYDLKVIFSKCLFRANFKEYHFYSNHDRSIYEDTDLGKINDINDTTITLSGLTFGAAFSLQLATYPGNIAYSGIDRQYEPFTRITAHTGDSSFAFSEIEAVPMGNDLYFMNNKLGNNLYMYSTVQNTIREVIHSDIEGWGNNHFDITSIGNYLFYTDAYSMTGKLFSLPEMTFLGANTLQGILADIPISNNSLYAAVTKTNLMIYDFNNNSCIDTLYSNYTGYYPSGIYYGADAHISSNGDYLYVPSHYLQDTLYQRINDRYIGSACLGLSTEFIDFNPFNSDELVYFTQNKVIILDTKTNTIKHTFPNLYPPFSNIDPISGYFIANEHSTTPYLSGIYDISDGHKISEILIGFETIEIFDSIIYTGSGYKMNILP